MPDMNFDDMMVSIWMAQRDERERERGPRRGRMNG